MPTTTPTTTDPGETFVAALEAVPEASRRDWLLFVLAGLAEGDDPDTATATASRAVAAGERAPAAQQKQQADRFDRNTQLAAQLANRWITIGAREADEDGKGGSKGRPVMIDENGRIVGGSVPREMQGKSVSDPATYQRQGPDVRDEDRAGVRETGGGVDPFTDASDLDGVSAPNDQDEVSVDNASSPLSPSLQQRIKNIGLDTAIAGLAITSASLIAGIVLSIQSGRTPFGTEGMSPAEAIRKRFGRDDSPDEQPAAEPSGPAQQPEAQPEAPTLEQQAQPQPQEQQARQQAAEALERETGQREIPQRAIHKPKTDVESLRRGVEQLGQVQDPTLEQLGQVYAGDLLTAAQIDPRVRQAHSAMLAEISQPRQGINRTRMGDLQLTQTPDGEWRIVVGR